MWRLLTRNTSCITKRPYKSFESTMAGRGLSLHPPLCSAPNTFVGTPSASPASLNVDLQIILINRVQRSYCKLRNGFFSWFGFINRAEKTRFRNFNTVRTEKNIVRRMFIAVHLLALKEGEIISIQVERTSNPKHKNI